MKSLVLSLTIHFRNERPQPDKMSRFPWKPSRKSRNRETFVSKRFLSQVLQVIVISVISKNATETQLFVDVLQNRCSRKCCSIKHFIGKCLCWSLFLIKLQKRLQPRCFPVKFAEFLKTTFLRNTSGGCFSLETTISR